MASKIDDIRQLDFLLYKKKKYNFYFDFKELNSCENTLWLERINKNYDACGCNTGKIFTAIAVILILLYGYLKFYGTDSEIPTVYYFISFVFLVSLALLGKYIGKKIAYNKLEKDISKLKDELNSSGL